MCLGESVVMRGKDLLGSALSPDLRNFRKKLYLVQYFWEIIIQEQIVCVTNIYKVRKYKNEI